MANVVAISPSKRRRMLSRIFSLGFVTAALIVILFPLYCMSIMAFEDSPPLETGVEAEKVIKAGGLTWVPYVRTFTLQHFEKLFTVPAWFNAIINSVLISMLNTAFCIALALPAAYIFSRVNFRFSKHLFFYIIMQRMVPAGAFIVPLFMIYTYVGLYDTIWGVVLAHAIFNLPLSIWILHGFMKDIPRSVDEAAFIDGHSLWSFWRKILVPQLLSAIGVAAFFAWMFSWTELVMAQAITRNKSYPITVMLLMALGLIATGTWYGGAAAVGILSMIPGIIILFFVRRQIIRGFMLGGRIE